MAKRHWRARASIVPISSFSTLMMPKLDGFEVCRRLKKDPALPFMPIILVTARGVSGRGHRARCRRRRIS